MFDMFRGGKPDPLTLMAVDYETQRSDRIKDLKSAAAYIRQNCRGTGSIDADEVAEALNIAPLNYQEIKFVENELKTY
jgi:hypothetical protein